MSQQLDTSSCSDDSEDNIIDPASIYTIEEFISEQSIMDNLLERITVKIQAKIEAQKAGTSHHPRGERKSLNRNHEGGHQRLVKDYFSQDPIYSDKQFRARYRMRKPIFLRIVHALGEWSPYFTNRRDASSRQGLSPLQKCTAAIRILVCGSLGDANEKYVEIGKSTELECLERFVEGVIDYFGDEYLRSHTSEDMQHIASHDCWRWHAFFCVIESYNEMKILSQPQLFTEVLKGQDTQVQFFVNRKQYNTGYYLADKTHPEGNVFIKTVFLPQSEKDRLFARHQEGARKDVQEAFQLLQSRFAIVRGPTRFFQQEVLAKIMQACIILHNMIIEDEKDMASACFDSDEISGTLAVILSDIDTVPADSFTEVLQRNASVSAPPTHTRLRRDLMEHIWKRFGPFGNQ